MMRNLLKNFKRNLSGNVAMTAALCMLPLAMAAGSAVDYSNSVSARSQVQEATDAAVLAAAKFQGTNAQKKAHGRKMFKANFYGDVGDFKPKIVIKIDAQGKVTGTATGEFPTSFMRIAGIDHLDVGAQAAVEFADAIKAEVVFVLDYSSSMGGSYTKVRDAAVGLIDTLTNNRTSSKVKIGLVPYSHYVHISVDGRHVVGGTPGVQWSNCTRDRQWPYVITDKKPGADNASKWGLLGDDPYSAVSDPDYYDPCDSFADNGLFVSPLSKNHSTTVSKLSAMTPSGNTNIALGMQIGWQVLSPRAPWKEGVKYSNTSWKKSVILMSDGIHNQEGFGSNGASNVSQGHQNLQSVCDAMKAKGINIIAIGYELDSDDDDNNAASALRNCASDASYYLDGDANNIDEIFEQIGVILSAGLRLSE